MGGIGVLVALVLLVFTSATISGMVVGAMTMDWRAFEAFALLSGAYLVLAAFAYLVSATQMKNLNRSHVFVGAIIMWFSLIFAAMPAFIMIEGAGPFVAFFEASSAATTLGSSLTPVSAMSMAMIVYRTATAWLGGLLTLMLAVYVLGRYAVGGTPNRDLRVVLHGASRADPRLFQTFWEVLVPYGAITLVCAALLVMVRVDPAQAVLGALNTLSTNGLIAWQTSGTIFNNRLAEIIMMTFMMVGASSIVWLRMLTLLEWRALERHGEARTFLVAAVVAVAAGIALSLGSFPLGRFMGDDLFNRAFDIISVLTTTGISHDVRQGVSVPLIFLIGLALVGGCSYSTAGGIKIFRLKSMLHHSSNEIKRLVYPNQILPGSVDADKATFVAAKATWSAFFSVLIFVMLMTTLFAALGHGFTASLSLAVGGFATVGNLVSDNLFTTSTPGVPVLTLVGVSLAGVVGRIELLVILAAFSRNRW